MEALSSNEMIFFMETQTNDFLMNERKATHIRKVHTITKSRSIIEPR